MDGRRGPDGLTIVAFAGAVLFGGLNFVAVRYSNRELAPNFGAGVRFAAAALLMLGYMAVRRVSFPRGRQLAAALVYGFLAFAVLYGLMYWALQDLPAGFAAIVFATTPLVTLGRAMAHRIEGFNRRGLLGAAITVAGIVVLANPSGGGVPVGRLLAVVGASVAAAEAAVLLKIIPPIRLAATNATAMTAGAVMLLALSASVREDWMVPRDAATWWAVGYLVVFGSVGFFALFLFTLRRWTATSVAYMTPLLPVVAMIGAAVVAGEPITRTGVIGGVVVLVGVYVGAFGPRRQVAPSSAAGSG